MRRPGVAISLLFLAHACFAETSEIDQLLEETGLRQEIFQLPAAINEISAPIMRQTCPGCSASTIASTTTVFRQTFEPTALYDDIRRRFEENYNSPYALDVFHDMEATVYGKMAALDTWADKPENRQQMAQAMASQPAMPAAKRRLLLQQLAQASGTTDVTIGLVCQIVRSVAPEPEGCPGISGPMKRAINEAMIKRWSYLYQNLSDDDISQAIRIARTPAERWFMATYAQAAGDAFAARMQVAMSRLTRQMAPARQTLRGLQTLPPLMRNSRCGSRFHPGGDREPVAGIQPGAAFSAGPVGSGGIGPGRLSAAVRADPPHRNPSARHLVASAGDLPSLYR